MYRWLTVALIAVAAVPAMAVIQINGQDYEMYAFLPPFRDASAGNYTLDSNYVESVGLVYAGNGVIYTGSSGDSDKQALGDQRKVYAFAWDDVTKNLKLLPGSTNNTYYGSKVTSDRPKRENMGLAIAPQGNSAGLAAGTLLWANGNGGNPHAVYTYTTASYPWYVGGKDGTNDGLIYMPANNRATPTMVTLGNEVYVAAASNNSASTMGLRLWAGVQQVTDFNADAVPDKEMVLGASVVWPASLDLSARLIRGGYQVNDTDAVFVVGGTSGVSAGGHFDPVGGGEYRIVWLRDADGLANGADFDSVVQQLDPLSINANDIINTGVLQPSWDTLLTLLKGPLLNGLDGVTVANDLNPLGPVYFLANGNRASANGGTYITSEQVMYVLSPVPEPATLCLLALGGLALLRRRAR